MPQSKILVDSNAYFRLAQSIHPLLKVTFGEQDYCLYVIKELQEEYDKNPRLKNAFSWVNQPEYKENRSHKLVVSREQQKEIEHAFEFVHDYAKTNSFSVSKVDISGLTHALILKVPIVTDDSDMLAVAEAFDIKALNTLELLKLMLDSNHVNMGKVKEIAAYWEYLNDKPKSFEKDYRRLFKETPPK